MIHVRNPSALALIDGTDYRPILAQRQIFGETIGISVPYDREQVEAMAAASRPPRPRPPLALG